jgi:hypothetical protein
MLATAGSKAFFNKLLADRLYEMDQTEHITFMVDQGRIGWTVHKSGH